MIKLPLVTASGEILPFLPVSKEYYRDKVGNSVSHFNLGEGIPMGSRKY